MCRGIVNARLTYDYQILGRYSRVILTKAVSDLSPSCTLFDQSIRKPDVRRGDYTSLVALLRTNTIEPSAVSYSAIVIAISMRLSAICRRIIATDTGVLVLSAMALVALHSATNGQYGFHRDELATIDDARFLAWGYVVYPPVTPFIARVALTLFGPSMIGLRFFGALAAGIAMVLTGLMAREIGGKRPAQLVAAWAAAIAGPAVFLGSVFQYVSFDYLWWVLAAWISIRLLKSEDQRWWLALGAVVGLGMMTKYTMAFFLAGIASGIVLTKPAGCSTAGCGTVLPLPFSSSFPISSGRSGTISSRLIF